MQAGKRCLLIGLLAGGQGVGFMVGKCQNRAKLYRSAIHLLGSGACAYIAIR